MAITPPSNRLWWKEPIHSIEMGWIIIAFLWGLFMFFFMIAWHFIGDQNLSNETYKIKPEVFEEQTIAFAEQYQKRDENGELVEEEGIPVVVPPEGGDVYMVARLWEFWPVLELKKDVAYRIHLSSADWQHGFSLQPVNINIQVLPGYEHIFTLTPTETGTFGVVCNEYCGIGHHTMTGRIRVVE
jgi:cytochrome c oxidase subunit II